ncbi:MAG: transporter substrate-binding domain-containing protein [Verrucomicrobia bacterium]|nr:transporter substrate-binding domain-containing protein [Verrucomicrobiota bacterium]
MILLRLLAVVTLLCGLIACGRSNKLIIGMDATYPPFEVLDAQGNCSGVSVDLGRALAVHLGREVEFRNISFDGLITALKSGSIDCVISSMTANDERRKSIAFSEPYVKNGLALLISAKSSVLSADDLKSPGRKIVVRLGTTGESYARDFLKDANIVAMDSDSACVLEVVNGNVDAWIYDQISIMRYHEQQPEATRALLKPLREEFWAIGLRQGDDALRDKVNEFLKKYRTEGGFASLADKHLMKEKTMMKQQGIPFVFDL